jgi:hypothetical protein
MPGGGFSWNGGYGASGGFGAGGGYATVGASTPFPNFTVGGYGGLGGPPPYYGGGVPLSPNPDLVLAPEAMARLQALAEKGGYYGSNGPIGRFLSGMERALVATFEGLSRQYQNKTGNPDIDVIRDVVDLGITIYHIPETISNAYEAFRNDPADASGYAATLLLEAVVAKRVGDKLFPSECPAAGSVHGNSTLSPRTAYLYRLEDANGNLLTWGVTQDLNTRYPKSFMQGKQLIEINSGSRADMLRLERDLVETQPGPLNREPWAGRRAP